MMGKLQRSTGATILTMGAFGERLRREREMRGITLDEISESTKISRRHLESLEKEDFDALPGGIFNKGFVRAYARYLGIDEDQAVADYSSVHSDQSVPADQFPLDVHDKPDPQLNPRRSPVPLVLALIALLVVLAVVWVRNRTRHTEGPANIAPAATTGTSVQNASATPAEAVPPDTGTATPSATPDQATPATVPEHTFVVLVKAKEDAWVSLTADGKKTWAGILRADTQKLVRAGKKIEIYTGNAGGLELSYNGRPLGAIGSESEVRTLTFTAKGLVQ
jgi:cytoskeleton protein RodZ